MELKTFIARIAGGPIVPGATYYVYLADTMTLATIYDKDGIVIANPGAASASGQIVFAAADGDYDLRVTDGVTLDNVMRVRFAESPADLRADLENDANPSLGTGIVGHRGKTLRDTIDYGFDTIDRDISRLIYQSGLNTVITGDSLSFNAYDWPLTNVASADQNNPGLMSWSFMLRDLIHRCDINFVHADQLDFISSNSATGILYSPFDPYYLPFNGRGVAISAKTNAETVDLMVSRQNQSIQDVVLHFCNAPSDSGKVDVSYSVWPYSSFVSAGTVTLTGRTGYNGYEMFTHKISSVPASAKPVKIRMTNWRTVADAAPPAAGISAFISAIGSADKAIKLTGKGGWTSAQILTDFNSMIGSHNPDLLFLICGANDRGTGVTADTYAANLQSLIDATKAVNPYCQIVALSTPPASNPEFTPGAVYAGSTIEQFIDAGRSVARANGCLWVDLFSLFIGKNPAAYRFDNIHFSKLGNYTLFSELKNRLFGNAVVEERYYDPFWQVTGGLRVGFDAVPSVGGWLTVSYSSATQLYTVTGSSDPASVIASVTRIEPYTMRVALNYSASDSRISAQPSLAAEQFGASAAGGEIAARTGAISKSYVNFYLIDATTGAVIDDAKNDGQQYIIKW